MRSFDFNSFINLTPQHPSMKRLLTAKEVLRLYNTSSNLSGGYSQDFSLKCVALDNHHDNPKLSTFRYTFLPHHRNLMNTVHGGALATFVDLITTVAILRMTPHKTVSISLNTEFLSPIIPGQEVQIDTEISKLGRNITFTECRIFTKPHEHRKLACKGQHIKAISGDLWDFMKNLQESK